MESRTYGVKLERSAPLILDRHPDAPRRQSWKQWAHEQKSKGPIAIDLFSGAGGLSLGLEEAGYTVVLAVDHDPASVQTHLANFPGAALNMDLAMPEEVDGLVDLVDGLEIDLVAGGPPCQPFSRAGRSKIRDLVQKGDRAALDPRRELWQAMLRVVGATRPKAVLMENVPDMALGDDMRTVRFIAQQLESWGYDTDMRIVDAWKYGVPQHRQRLILVGMRDGFFEWPKDNCEPIPLREVLSDLPKLRGGTGARSLAYKGPISDFQSQARAGMNADESNVVFDHMTRPVREDDRQAFRLLKAGTRYSALPDDLKRYRDDIFDDKYNRLPWDGLSRSITAHIAKDGYWYIHPREHRTLTVREAARIQTFPDRFRFAGSRSDAFRLIGNAVPPRLGEVIGRELIAAWERPAGQEPTGSESRRRMRQALLRWGKRNGGKYWRSVGDPWRATVTAVVGTRNAGAGEALLQAAPTEQRYLQLDADVVAELGVTPSGIRRLDVVAGHVSSSGWQGIGDCPDVPRSILKWIETAGFRRMHVNENAGSLRVAARLEGESRSGGVRSRMLLGQLVGYEEDAALIQAAIGDLAASICTSKRPDCIACPLRAFCRTAAFG